MPDLRFQSLSPRPPPPPTPTPPPTDLPTRPDELSYGLFWSRNRSPVSFLFRGGSADSGGPFG